MTTSSNSWAKLKGDKSRVMPFLAESFICRCAICGPSSSPLTRGESQVDFKKILSLLRSFCSTSWKQHEWAVSEQDFVAAKFLCHELEEFHPHSLHASFPPDLSFSPFLNTISVLLLLTSKPCTRSPLPFRLHSGREKREKLAHCVTVQNLLQWLQFKSPSFISLI